MRARGPVCALMLGCPRVLVSGTAGGTAGPLTMRVRRGVASGPALAAPAGWDFHANGHAAAGPQGIDERVRAADRRRPNVGDPVLISSLKSFGEAHALNVLNRASTEQRARLGAPPRVGPKGAAQR